MKEKITYVVDRKGSPLMPTKNSCKVRHLLDEGKAVVICSNPFTIRLKYDVPGYTQKVYEGIDTGRENIGDACSLENGENVLLVDVKTNNKSIKQNMQDRAGFRRERRRHNRQKKQRKARSDGTEMKNGDDDTVRTKHSCKSRKVSYPGADESVTHKLIQGKEAKFNNRTREEGWITPSARQLIQITMEEIRQTVKILPVREIHIERVSFDFQKLENENIKAWEYGKGPLYGFKSYKDYINAEQHGRCLLCGKPHIDYYHHINQQKDGKYDHVSNIAGLCEDCHYGPYGVHQDVEAETLLRELKAGSKQRYKVGLLNSVMPMLLEEVTKYCNDKGIKLVITDGKTTSDTRNEYGLVKEHCIDAYAISLAGRDVENAKPMDTILMKRRFKKKSKNKVSARGKRVYKLNGKIVAYNRHKATDQKEDSLEEFMAKCTSSHSEKECNKLMHKLEIVPAKRIHTYHKDNIVSPIKPGDMVLYEKHNKIKGNTKRLVFPAVSVEFSETLYKTGVIREWKIGVNDNKVRKGKFCKPLSGGCLQVVGTENISEHIAKVIEAEIKRKKAA